MSAKSQTPTCRRWRTTRALKCWCSRWRLPWVLTRPRAFTLAALRGTRDANFGIQVVGRIMRVHSLLQRRPHTPQVLNYGYVFLANREAQEGLMGAASVINKLKENTANTVPDTVITFTADSSFVQIVKSGQTAAIFPDSEPAAPAAVVPDSGGCGVMSGAQSQSVPRWLPQTSALFPELAKSRAGPWGRTMGQAHWSMRSSWTRKRSTATR